MWPRAVLLDLDGTLVDSFPALTVALDRALTELSRPAASPGWVTHHVGHGLAVLLDQALPDADEADRSAFETAFRRHYEAIFLAATPPMPGAGAALGLLAGGAALAVVSNKPVAWSRRLVEHLGWKERFGAVVGPETAGATKPSPAMVDAALLALGATRGEALLVGDMTVDVATGRAAAVPVVGMHDDADTRGDLITAGALAALPGIAALPTWLARAGRGWEHLATSAAFPPDERRRR